MEQLNSVILRGIIGNARIQNIGDTEMARFSVATDHAYKNRSGEAVIETTWHQVTAFLGKLVALDYLTVEKTPTGFSLLLNDLCVPDL